MSTAIVTDTTAYLPEDLIARHEIERVSLYVSLDGEQRAEAEIAAADYAEFYERLLRSEDGASTSQPSVGDFIAVYEPLLEAGREIVSVHLSSAISGTCDSATQARDQLSAGGRGGDRIHVLDSRTACGGRQSWSSPPRALPRKEPPGPRCSRSPSGPGSQ